MQSCNQPTLPHVKMGGIGCRSPILQVPVLQNKSISESFKGIFFAVDHGNAMATDRQDSTFLLIIA